LGHTESIKSILKHGKNISLGILLKWAVTGWKFKKVKEFISGWDIGWNLNGKGKF